MAIATMSSHNDSMMNGGTEEEIVTATPDEKHENRYIAEVLVKKTSGVNSLRDFEATDMARVLDFEEASGKSNAVGDETVMVADYVGDGTSHITFPKYYVVLRGGFLFCFEESDVDTGGGRYTTYEAPPVRIVPLDRVDVQFPPGGRRVFREHAQTAAQTGYELIVQHTPSDEDEERRPPVFLVAESLGKRNKWAEAIRARSKFTKKTVLRAGYNHTAAAAAAAAEDPLSQSNREERKRNLESRNGNAGRNDEMVAMIKSDNEPKKTNFTSGLGRSTRTRDSRSMEKKIMEVSDDSELAAAVLEFGSPDFNEEEWMADYWETHHEMEAVETCQQMERWLSNMKKSLKGAVLEQYEYFVQASGEMTTMGREVASLKSRIETQVDTLREMKEIDFLGALTEDDRSDKDELMGREEDDDSDIMQNGQAPDEAIFGDDLGEMMDRHRGVKSAEGETETEEASPTIEVPEWLEDVEEEIVATIRECRYNSAIDLYLKAMNEINDLIEKHDRPTAYRLTRSQLDTLRATRKTVKALGDGISARLVESLRRKNEALKQAYKRERSDATASLAPVVSPCALNDDALYLQLLAKLGRTQEAAEAYSGRRSLLLLETLQERPMSGAGTVDLVIYAAQLSQSFFSCLASSVEGFLDLFLVSAPPPALNGDKSAEDSDASSLHSHSLGPATKNLPAGAVSALVLWCDAELSKFAIAFGGTRILSNLALSPPKGMDAPRGPRVVEGSGMTDTSKDRKNAIEVAAQCIDQAFLYASKNLDSVGLPLTPRLAEMIRVRLKGCEREVSFLLDERWHNLTQDWRTKTDGTSSFSLGPPRY